MTSAFIHVPKTGGTSLRQALQRALGDRLLVSEREEGLFQRPFSDYGPGAMLFGHLSWDMCLAFGASARFTVLREPIERCVSQVQHWITDHGEAVETTDYGMRRRVVLPERGFAWNVEHLIETQDIPQYRALCDAQVHQLAGHHIERTPSERADVLQQARANLAACDLVGITEDLPRFVRGLSHLVGQELDVGIEKAGLHRARDLAVSLPAAARAKLRRVNELDLELYQAAVAARHCQDGRTPRLRAAGGTGLLLRAGPPRADVSPVLDVPGRIRGRLCDYLADVSETQGRFGVVGSLFADQAITSREAALLTLLAGQGETLATAAPKADRALFPDMADPALLSGARLDPAVPVRLAILQGLAPPDGVTALASDVAYRLVPYGVVLLLDAAHYAARGAPAALAPLRREYGLIPFAAIDTHLLLCHYNMAWFWRVLLRAKLGHLEITRIREDGADVLKVETDY